MVVGSGVLLQGLTLLLISDPETQSLRFDETGDYIRKYVKELRDCPNKEVHMPSNPKDLGYVEPIVDLKTSRQKAIDVFGSIKKDNYISFLLC